MEIPKNKIEFITPIQYLPKVGPKTAKKLAKLGVETIGDLIHFYPRKYNDYTDIVTIKMINNQFSISNQYPSYNNQIRESATIKAKIVGIANKKTRRRGFTVTEAVVADDTGTLKVVWFNQPYLVRMLWAGREIILHGKVNYDQFNQTLVLESPDWAEKPKIVPIYRETDGISSHYVARLVESIKVKVESIEEFLPADIIRKNNFMGIREAVWALHQPQDMSELEAARRRMAFDELFLISLRGQIIKQELQQESAPAFNIERKEIESFIADLPFELTKDQKKAIEEITADVSTTQNSKAYLEYPREVISQNHNLKNNNYNPKTNTYELEPATCSPMNRLINGDVGSGKTIVAAIAAYVAVKSGYNVLFMAPTEILARQHWESFTSLFKPYGIQVGLCTASNKNQISKIKDKKFGTDTLLKKNNIKSDNYQLKPETYNLAPQIYVGTHALLYMKEPIENVGLVIVDEQHRFGVRQRQALKKLSIINDQYPINNQNPKADNYQLETETCNLKPRLSPHFLSMTATPIPRSLQLALFGELDISVIKEKPKNRKEIKTRVVDEVHREKAYQFIRAHVKAGNQVFVVVPLIEEQTTQNQKSKIKNQNDRHSELDSESIQNGSRNVSGMTSETLFEVDRKTVMGEYDKLSQKIFPDLRIGMLHGKMTAKEKDVIMDRFSNMELDILVSTSVVEVGVDIANATIMMIEDAERFGLAQLHQFRGRVGRSDKQSFCFLFSNSQSEKSLDRLKIMESVSDGFKLAEFDLKSRGAGDIFGTEQSGFMDVKFANLSDTALISQASHASKELIAVNRELSNLEALKNKLKNFEASLHLE